MNHRFPILIVDDDRISRKFREKTIRKAGNEVVSVENGKKALEIMNERFFPIILLTMRDSQDDIITGLEAGADDHLTKPFNFAELIARINTGKRILELESSLKRANEDLNALSITDPLTGFYNRRYMTARFSHEINRQEDTTDPTLSFYAKSIISKK